ncbi:MAG: NAD(P)H-dependent oxidoreductase subunit E, partial [Bacteroidales bacterium]|nr:NAD(P)H-dependent oxidoreductase subunit E [Bacteroidales bacterium]
MRIQRISLPEQEAAQEESEELDLSVLDPLIEKYKNEKGNVIPLLQGAQQRLGYIPREAFEKISRETGLEKSQLYGVATFYA